MTKLKIKIAIALAIMMIAVNVFPYIYFNNAGTGYDVTSGDQKVMTAGNSINRYIEDIAANFLLAKADILTFSNLYELSDSSIDYEEWLRVLNSAEDNIKKSMDAYSQLIQLAETTPYNQAVLDKLMNFNYPGFLSKHNLNTGIYLEVEFFLNQGNVTGAFKKIAASLDTISGILTQIKAEVNADTMPGLTDIWRINEEFSTALLFGEYVAMVFSEINL
ncbi:MAG: hypothetical protein GY757_08870 [bacterium]|nr:hypothetical protein [bacterium]